MVYDFLSVDEFISSFEKELMDVLYDYGLLTKFSRDSKKVLFYLFFKHLNDVLENPKLLLYHNHVLNSDHEILQYYPEKDLNTFVNKLCSKTKKLTRRLIYIKSNRQIPKKSHINDLDGEVVDQVVLINNEKPSNLKDLKKLLDEVNLTELFKNMALKVA
jgi:hypothetical protein